MFFFKKTYKWCLVSFSNFVRVLINWLSSDFVDHSCNYRPNWIPVSPVTIIICINPDRDLSFHLRIWYTINL